MTASIAGLGAGEDTSVALRPKHPTRSHEHEWQSIYRHELLRKEQAPVERPLPQKQAPTTTFAAAPLLGCPADSGHGSSRLRAVVIAVAGHLELKYITGAGTAALDSLAAEALAAGDSHDMPASPAVSPQGAGAASPTARAVPPMTPVATPSGLSGDGAAPPPSMGPAEEGPSGKPSQDRRAAPSDREQALESVANGAAAPTVGALACVPVAPPGRTWNVALRSGSRNPIPLATALTLAASQGPTSLSVSTAGSSQKRGQDTQSRQSGSDDVASGGAAGARGVSHGTFPLIVSGQLMELEFVSLGTDAKATRRAAQQIVLSVQPPGLPRFELTARKLDGKVAVTVAASAASGAGCGTGLDLPSLLRRLGWGSLPVELTDTGAFR
jgi:hypothetical protein